MYRGSGWEGLCSKVIYYRKKTILILFSVNAFGRELSPSHFLEKFWIMFKESIFSECAQGHSLLWAMFSSGMWRHLLSHDSLPVKLIAFNAKAYIYGGISRNNSYIQWKVEVLLFFKYLKITKWFSRDLSSCNGGSVEKKECLTESLGCFHCHRGDIACVMTVRGSLMDALPFGVVQKRVVLQISSQIVILMLHF